MTTASTSNMALVASGRRVHGTTAGVAAEDDSLRAPARRLADAARELRDAGLREPMDVTLAFTDLEAALDALAAAAELTAYAVIDAAAPAGGSLAQPAPPRARAVSWRLHALSSDLRGARATCREVNDALRASEPPIRPPSTP